MRAADGAGVRWGGRAVILSGTRDTLLILSELMVGRLGRGHALGYRKTTGRCVRGR
ncbi:hypothetical protein HYPSUDRAFT_445041 [Hypholoma sublateritium FD-334 SS-4]|uniref:Uncharacterized protein n=1 Tax=Hypholoma sublateritium (strain FD-334 SS-4) TaxID=945553 RepID=A0A0D2N5K6_HYPSF|nr:hypothetical protein HYPSUDRAFT_445041 [Hypholoma sublateritium FD-334 SS-4]